MGTEIYKYRMTSSVDMKEVEETLLLAVIAAEGLHGRSKINLDASFCLHEEARVCEVDASNDVGRDIARIFTGLLTTEMGESAFKVERMGKTPNAHMRKESG